MAIAAPVTSRQDVELKRQIGLYAATAITVGNIIGSGIFRSPHSVARELSSVPVVIFAWVLGGILSLCGSLALAELAVTHPKTGGLYVFIREGFGRAWGFMFGWANLWVIKPTVIASIPILFAYDGWTDSTYVAGEIVAPSRTLPFAIVWGTVLVIVTYVVTNLAYFRVLAPAEVARYEAVGSEAIGRLLGDGGRHALAV